MNKINYPDLVLGVALTSRGMGFVMAEGPQAPFDWGIAGRDAKQRSRLITAKLSALIQTYQPVVVVIEDISTDTSRHSVSLKRLSRRIAYLAQSEGTAVFLASRKSIREVFEPLGALTKPEIAEAVGRAMPALSHRQPPKRKLWMSEDARQLIFDAAALAITYYARTDHEPVR